MRTIGVIGSSRASESEVRTAFEVGALIARSGHALVCGGLGGVMEAACRGAKSEGGLTVGIIPSEDPDDANPHVDVVIPTGFGVGRNVLVVRSARVIIAVGGSTGTLSEIAFALNTGRMVVGLGTWDLTATGRDLPGYVCASSPGEAVGLALRSLARE